MDRLEVAHRRLHNQHLSGPPLPDPAAVVRHLGASQAQEYAMAKWSLGQRSAGADDAAVAGRARRGDDPAHARPAPDVALRGPGGRPLDAGAHRTAGAADEPLLRAPVGDRRRPRGPRDGRDGGGAPGREPPDAPAGAGRARAAGDRGERHPAGLPGDGGRAGGRGGQRGPARQAAHVRAARRAGAADARARGGRGARRADPPVLRQPRPGDRQGLPLVVEPDAHADPPRPGDRGGRPDVRRRRRAHLLVRAGARRRRGTRHRPSTSCRGTTSTASPTRRAGRRRTSRTCPSRRPAPTR